MGVGLVAEGHLDQGRGTVREVEDLQDQDVVDLVLAGKVDLEEEVQILVEGDHHIHDPHQGVGSFVSEGEEDHACLVRLEAEEDHLVPEDQGQVRSLSGLIDQVLALVRGPVKKLGVDDRLDPVPHQE